VEGPVAVVRVELSGTQRELRDTVRAFAQERVKPAAAETDRASRFPREVVAELGRLGVMGCFVPERYGGAGFDYVAYALAVEELSAACAATGVIFSAHASLATWPILALGTEAQRDRYLPRMARGEWLGCFALSEPSSGSDAGSIRTTARRDGDHYVLNGTKNFITNGPDAAVAIVFASLDVTKGNKGLAAFIVETASPGWEVVRVEEKMGIHGALSAQLAFTDLRVPRENLLGAESEGFKAAMKTLDGGRIGIAAQAVGIARAALEASLTYARERRAFGKALADFQGTQWRLADMATAVEAARLLTLRAAFLKDRGLPYTKEAAMAKLFAAETAMTIATQAVQLHGGYGYTREFAVERYFRDAKITEIYEGTSEIQRVVIASQLLRGMHA
jgi:butyryl-CoA dehydrogenase